MAVHPVRALPDPVLRQMARRVPGIDAAIHTLIEDMVESMYAAHGVGLAAPQIGVALRVIVIGLPDRTSMTWTFSRPICSGPDLPTEQKAADYLLDHLKTGHS